MSPDAGRVNPSIARRLRWAGIVGAAVVVVAVIAGVLSRSASANRVREWTDEQALPSVPALTDVVSGQIQFMMVDLAIAMGMIQEGKVQAYGVPSATRVKAMPDIPTIAEAGVPGYAGSGWFSVVARAGTPRSSIDKINGILTAYLKQPEVQTKLYALAIQPLTQRNAPLSARNLA